MFGKRFTGCITLLLAILIVLFVGACASTPKKSGSVPSAAVKESYPSDNALFHEGIALLGTSYTNAREAFDKLVKVYPNSKWRPYAEALLKLLDDLNLASNRAMADRLEARSLEKETESLRSSLEQARRTARGQQEKLQAEVNKLSQENEQLKNDLQRLKRLEIEMLRRGRSFR